MPTSAVNLKTHFYFCRNLVPIVTLRLSLCFCLGFPSTLLRKHVFFQPVLAVYFSFSAHSDRHQYFSRWVRRLCCGSRSIDQGSAVILCLASYCCDWPSVWLKTYLIQSLLRWPTTSGIWERCVFGYYALCSHKVFKALHLYERHAS